MNSSPLHLKPVAFRDIDTQIAGGMGLHASRAVQEMEDVCIRPAQFAAIVPARAGVFYLVQRLRAHFKNRLPNVLCVFERVRRFKGDAAWFPDSIICQNEFKRAPIKGFRHARFRLMMRTSLPSTLFQPRRFFGRGRLRHTYTRALWQNPYPYFSLHDRSARWQSCDSPNCSIPVTESRGDSIQSTWYRVRTKAEGFCRPDAYRPGTKTSQRHPRGQFEFCDLHTLSLSILLKKTCLHKTAFCWNFGCG